MIGDESCQQGCPVTCYKINKIKIRKYHFYRLILTLSIVSILILEARRGHAQDTLNAEQLPKRILLPWQNFNLTSEFLSAYKGNFKSAKDAWMNQVMGRPTTLAKFLTENPGPQNRISNNLLRQLAKIYQGEAKGELLINSPLALQPLICPIGNRIIFFTTITHTIQQNLLGSGHHSISRQQLQIAADRKQLTRLLSDSILKSWKRAVTTAKRNLVKSDALQTGLRSGRAITRKDYGSGDCLNLLLAEKLIQQQYTLTQSIGIEYLASLQYATKQKSKHMRNTRIIILNWSFHGSEYPAKTEFPLSLKVSARLAESVFGSSITRIPESEWILSAEENGTLQIGIKKEFLEFLADEKKALDYKSDPKIARVYGSWIYVDKGRAWGLKLLDRLTVKENPGKVRGHVIKFFGPELKLKNTNGQIINEGAILFVRKGQRLTKPGQSLVYDQTEFPTPWPPASSAP